ncbi:hypothetical protein [Lentimicrobium sp.]|uniref:hypothetical protein n=1 Tax=Lentimicrobium sp. TaxID=2034841 RepID=UPI002D1FAC54|nr:hypothetical protein [Lentimicrobium sp.]
MDNILFYLKGLLTQFKNRLTMLNPNDPPKAFLLNEILTSSMNAGLQTRNHEYPVYKKDVKDFKSKECMVLEIRKILLSYAKGFENISETDHFEKIRSLTQHITEKYGDILHNDTFRLGISQKIINLFLKYLWCLGWIKEPFHCPFDSIIKDRLINGDSSIQLADWTKMNSMDEYYEYVKRAKERATASGYSIPSWELHAWNNRNSNNAQNSIGKDCQDIYK